MRSLLVICVVCMQLAICYGLPANQGVGAFAYQDTAGNRYGGTYNLNDKQVYNPMGPEDFTTFGPNPFPDFQVLDSFFPEYFRNFENLLQEAFSQNLEQQKIAMEAAKKAFDLTSNQAGYIPNFGFDSRFGGVTNFVPPFNTGWPDLSPQNSAFAGASVGPGFQHQMINLSPINPQMPNINVIKMGEEMGGPNRRQFYSVSSSSFASSNNRDGKLESFRGGETVVNDNGKITSYAIHN